MTGGARAVIVGGGLMGLSAAWHLRRADPIVRVTVLEREHAGAAASGASAGGVRAMFRDPAERALALAALTRWAHLDQELDSPTGYRRGGDLRLEPRPLQMLLTDRATRVLGPVIGAFGYKLSLKQLGDGAFLIGGGWPADLPDARANHSIVREDSVDGSLATARAVYPPLDRRAVVQRWAGIEAFGEGDLPTLGPVPGVRGLLIATGFSGHGFALVPAVGDVLARLALGRDPQRSLWSGLAWGTRPRPAAPSYAGATTP